ncbi:Transposon Tf2-9 polyprotein [Trichinella zimbabwensis]|uniref:Transposon Tf2-9 polyprotein n=1 Tax=Trichinella zimbabwensis TaxID=268475 RepID=A0A0V1I5G6_9BILA|nr:Transposon Tf2-9 polyprotein [Trichinella zimbabwensis]
MPPELLTWSSDVERLFIRIERYFRAADRRAAMVEYHMDEAMGDVLLAMEAEETDDYDKHNCLDTLVFGVNNSEERHMKEFINRRQRQNESEQEAGGGYLPTLSVILEQFSDVLAASDEDLGRTSTHRISPTCTGGNVTKRDNTSRRYRAIVQSVGVPNSARKKEGWVVPILRGLPTIEQRNPEGCTSSAPNRRHVGRFVRGAVILDARSGQRLLLGDGYAGPREDCLHHPVRFVPVQGPSAWSLDDVIVFGRTAEEHTARLREVLDRLRKVGLKVKPETWQLMKRIVAYLAHIVYEKGIATDSGKTRALRQFLGLTSAVPEVRKRLLEGDTRWKWTEDCQAAFDAVKHQLTSAPIFAYPDFRRRFLVDVDASGDGLGAVLSQRDGSKERVEHRPGRLHGNADVLSRTSCAQCGRPMKSSMRAVRAAPSGSAVVAQAVRDQLLAAQQADPEIQRLRQWVLADPGPNWIVEEGLICRRRDGLMAEEGAKHVLVPRALRSEIMIPAQQSVRGPPRRTCRTCTQCAARKSPSKNSRALMQPMTASYPLQRVGMDILGPLERIPFVNRYVLVLTDYFTRWTAAFPLANMEAETVAKELCHLFDIRKTQSSPYHPQWNRQDERFNRTLLGMLSIMCEENRHQWDEMRCLASCWRTTVNVNESTGVAPAMAMFGRELQLPLGIQMGSPQWKDTETLPNYIRQTSERIDIEHEQMRRQLKVQQRWQKSLYDRKATQEPLRLAPADITSNYKIFAVLHFEYNRIHEE